MEQTLGKRIMQNRKRLGLTQDQLAERLGVTAQAVSKWENDQSCPDISTLPRLAEIFDISIDELMGAERPHGRPSQAAPAEPEDSSSIHVNNGKWEFHLDAGRRGSIGFACWVLLMGLLLLMDSLTNKDIGFWNLAWPSFLLVMGLFGGKKFSFMRLGSVVLGAYFLLDNIGLLPFELGGDILWPALVILFGLGLLADVLRKPKHSFIRIQNKDKEPGRREQANRCDIHDGSFECENCFSDGHYLICADVLSHGEVDNSFGSATVDLSDVRSVAADCSIEVECNFGEVQILVPRRFAVCVSPETAFGSIETKGEPESGSQGSICMSCEANFGSIRIIYI